MASKREITKILIQLSESVGEADEIIEDQYHFQTVQEKIAFLKGMFGVELIGHENDAPDEQSYIALLRTVIRVLDT